MGNAFLFASMPCSIAQYLVPGRLDLLSGLYLRLLLGARQRCLHVGVV